MQNAWFFFVLILVILAIVGWALLRFKLERPRKVKDLSLLAHTDVIAALPEYKKAEKQYYRLLILALVLFAITIGSVTTLAARPMSITHESEDYETRDIMICADVSGSMHDVDVEVFDYMREVVASLKGQRIGLTLFNGAPVMFSPLSNDYVAIDGILESLTKDIDDYVATVDGTSFGSSKIGSSTIGCMNNFDKLEDEERSRALILITDNINNDKITLTQAAEYGMRYGVVLYNINAYSGDIAKLTSKLNMGDITSEEEYEMYKTGNVTGGNYYIVCADTSGTECQREDGTAKKIVDDIMKQEAVRTKGAPRPVRNDSPQVAAIVALISFSALVFVIWRIKL